MADSTVQTTITGGHIQGVAGAGTVHVGIMNFYGRAVEHALPAHVDAALVQPCPYPGLAYFGPDEANMFFGRDTAIKRLNEAVTGQSLTALVGASGTGKSSIVLAGLAPWLHRTDHWLFSYFRIGTEPDRDPFRALARSMVPLYVDSTSDTERLKNTKELATSLQAGELTLHDVFADCRSRNKGRRILFIADQFEEAFTLVEDEAVRQRFIDVLLAGFSDPATGSSPDISLILTLRADFYGRALRYRSLADALQGHVENLGPMNRDELQAAIVCPAREMEVSFDPGLVQTLLDDVESKPGSLPLLQFALREMWGRQANRTITRAGYDAIGGVEGAVAQRAEMIFTALTQDGANTQMEKAFQRLFTRLVTLGEGQEDTRRVVERRELGDEVWHLAQRLAGEDNRLVVTNAPASTRETAEVVHEALIRHWPKLVDWISRDRAFQSWLRQIHGSVALWLANPTDDGPLLRGSMLAQATDWLSKRRDDLSLEEQGFLAASIAVSEGRQRQARHAVVRARIAAVVFLVLFVGASLVTVGFVGVSTEAEERSQAAYTEAREAARQTSRAQASLAKIENDRARYFEAARAALAGLTGSLTLDTNPDQLAPWAELVRTTADSFLVPPLQHEDLVETAVFDSAGERIITASHDNTARIWNTRTGEPIGKPLQHKSKVYKAVFDLKGERVVTASEDRTARIWDARTGEPIGQPLQHKKRIWAAVFDPAGERVVTASEDRTARIWDARTGEPIGKPLQHGDKVYTAVFDPTGERVVTASHDETAQIWDARTGAAIRQPLQHGAAVSTAVFDHTGERVVTASQDNTAQIWDARTGKPVGKPLQHGGEVGAAVFDHTGERVVTVANSTAQIWDARTGKPVGRPLQHRNGVYTAVFDPTGERVVTASSDKTAQIWDVRTGKPIGKPLQHGNAVYTAVFDPTGERVVTASQDKTARVWDARIDRPIAKLLKYKGAITNAMFDLTGERVVTVFDDEIALVWDTCTGEPIGKPLQHGGMVKNVVFDPTGKRVITMSSDTLFGFSDALTGEPIGQPLNHECAVPTSAFDATSGRVMDGCQAETALIWDARTGEPIGKPMQHKGRVTAVFDRTGERVVTASQDSTAQIWDARTGEPIGKPLQHGGAVWAAVFDPAGERVVTASSDKTAQIWDARTGEPIGKPLQHGGAVWAAVFDPAGERVVTASSDKTAQIWDARTGEPIGQPLQYGNAVWAAVFDRTGERVVTASQDNTAQIWDARTGEPIGQPLQHGGKVRAAVFDPANGQVMTVSRDRVVSTWRAPPTGHILLNQVRSTLGQNAPKPLQIPAKKASRTSYDAAVAQGLNTIWIGTLAYLRGFQ